MAAFALISSPWILVSLVFWIAIAGALIGIRMADRARISTNVLLLSGGFLAGIALFWVAPEIVSETGWQVSVPGMAGGFAVLWVVDRYVYPICPSCSHTHDHSGCAKRLHGFSIPLIAAAGAHNFFDGWGLIIAQENASGRLKAAFAAGLAFHKFPEGLALGGLLFASTASAGRAIGGVFGVQVMMLFGAAAALLSSAYMPPSLAAGVLAACGGAFLYLGYHAIESQLHDGAKVWNLMSALSGAAGAAVLRLMPGL
jgi:zinc transporter ZupT